MLHRRLTRALAPLAFMALALFSACKDNPVTPASPASVEGVWQIVTVNGQESTPLDLYWTFSKTEGTYEQGFTGCISDFTYTLSGNKLILTVVTDGCLDALPGSKDTITYTVNGDKMTMNDHGDAFTLKKVPASSTALLGRWEAETVDGQGSSTGNRLFYDFTNTTVKQTVSGNGASCETMYHITRSGNAIHFTVTSDDCGEVNVGDEDQGTYTISGNKLTMVLTGGTTIVCKRA
jgi:hypothetical protein